MSTWTTLKAHLSTAEIGAKKALLSNQTTGYRLQLATSRGSMDTSALGIMLRHLRDKKQLSLRRLGELAELDHAYIYRLEKGDKGSPSLDVLDRLARALELSTRDREILEFIAERPDTDPRFAELAMEDQTISADEFFTAASAVYRGRARPDPRIMIERARRLLRDESEDG